MVMFVKKHLLEILFAAVSAGVILIDQVSKYVVEVAKPQLECFFLTLHYVQNTGAGFGILQNHTSILTVISLIVALAVVVLYKKIPRQKIPQLLFALFLGGVLGNFIDRLLRGYVIDFIDLSFWPAFNVADAAISVSVVGLVLYFWKE